MTEALEKKDDQRQRCGNCNAWSCTSHQPSPQTNQRPGLCRAAPPTPFLMDGGAHPLNPTQRQIMVQAYFPPMAESGWCRDWDTDADETAAPPEGGAT